MRKTLIFSLLMVCLRICASEILESGERWYSWARFHFNLRQPVKALECAEKCLDCNPYHEEAFLLLQSIRE
ncbi:MAG: hypothetical protein PHQ23_17055, partial [Candidatus Wallbacteria bacterium]|nr:hypothetical protein [Candidatus Wallbacteria bacterium]